MKKSIVLKGTIEEGDQLRAEQRRLSKMYGDTISHVSFYKLFDELIFELHFAPNSIVGNFTGKQRFDSRRENHKAAPGAKFRRSKKRL